jgi:urea transport system substrate-binding protein
MWRAGWLVVGVAAVVAAVGWWLGWPGAVVGGWARPPIRVGILHSLTGPMAISEVSMRDAEILALEEINQQGGLLGRKVEWVVADGRSDGQSFAREAEALITNEKVSVIFGCWNSTCRKSVKPVVERLGHLLVYPVAYEGLEESPHIIYTGAAPNQQIIPAVKWCGDQLKARRFFLIGSDSVWAHAVNTIVKDQLKALGAESLGEEYLSEDGSGIDAAVKKVAAAKPDVVLSAVEGELNIPFYQALRSAGVVPSKIPVLTFSMTEDEFRKFPTGVLTGDYAVCNYFQTIDRPENDRFVRAFKAKYGQERTTCDAIATAYSSVRLWAQAVREAESDEVPRVQGALLRQSLDAPEGVISIDRDSRHTWRPFFVGRIRGDGLVDIVWTSVKPIRPVPYPFSRSRADWESFLGGLFTGWGGRWEPPRAGPGSSVRAPEHVSDIGAAR